MNEVHHMTQDQVDTFARVASRVVSRGPVMVMTNAPTTYWIESDIYYCPICGGEDKLPERIYDRPRPDDWSERNHIIERWDYCDAL